MNRIIDVATAPDGERVVYSVRSADPETGTETTSMWLLDLLNRNPTPKHLADDVIGRSAAWSADGQVVYFLSARSGSSQVWRIAAGGGDPSPVTNLPLPVSSFKLSPRADRLFLTMDVFIYCRDLDCTVRELSEAGSVGSGTLHEHLFVRRWDQWSDERRSQLFTVSLNKQGHAGSAPIRLSYGIEGDVPSRPFGDREDYTVSPDGQHVIFAEQLGGTHEPWFMQVNLFEVPADGGVRLPDGAPARGSEPRQLTEDNRAYCMRPAFSPDGGQIAFLATERPNDPQDRRRLEILTLASGARRVLSPSWDESIDRFAWAPDGKSLLVTTDHLGQHPLWRIDLRTGQPTALTTDGEVEWFSAGAKHTVYTLSTLKTPAELYLLSSDRHPAAPLTALNRSLLEVRSLSEFEPLLFQGWNQETVHAYFVKPAELSPDKKTPLTVMIHDGPHESLANRWDWRWNAQTFAAGGVALLLVDYHGSTGYGQAFADATRGEGGGRPLEDIMGGIDAALKRYSWLNPERVCAIGDGYGGELVEWLAGREKSRFRCFVSHAGIFDTRSAYYTTDVLSLPEAELNGTAYDNPKGFAQTSPVELVSEWRAPILFTHGELDFRVPYTEGLAAFTAAQRRGVYSALLLFPDEGHWIAQPRNSMQWYHTTLGWIQSMSGVSGRRAPPPVKSKP